MLFRSSRFSAVAHAKPAVKTPYFRKYNFKNSYGGTLEPLTAQDAPWLHEPSLLKYKKVVF
jgi:hypothetical protein